MLIRSILRWKTALALKRSCIFSRAKIERINTVARHVLLQNQCWFVVDLNIVNKFQQKLNKDMKIFIQENTILYVSKSGGYFVSFSVLIV